MKALLEAPDPAHVRPRAARRLYPETGPAGLKARRLLRGDATRDMGRVRPRTTEERTALQTFPPGYEFKGSATQQELQVGNAVPPLLAAAAARAARDR